MNIFFDLDKQVGFFDSCSLMEKEALRTIWEYVYDRIKVLEKEIEGEELQGAKCIIIFLATKPRAIQPRGYSQELHTKILECFNENDVDLLWRSVDNALMRFIN